MRIAKLALLMAASLLGQTPEAVYNIALGL